METQKEYLARKVIECDEKAAGFFNSLKELNDDGTMKNSCNLNLVIFYKNAKNGFQKKYLATK